MKRPTIFAIGYALLIFGLSSIPGSSYPTAKIFSHDKVIHLLEYAGFAFTLAWALPNLRSVWLIVLFASLFGMADEIYQAIVPGRDNSVADWGADTLGAVLGVYTSTLWRGRK